jgi:hypothetical protein
VSLEFFHLCLSRSTSTTSYRFICTHWLCSARSRLLQSGAPFRSTGTCCFGFRRSCLGILKVWGCRSVWWLFWFFLFATCRTRTVWVGWPGFLVVWKTLVSSCNRDAFCRHCSSSRRFSFRSSYWRGGHLLNKWFWRDLREDPRCCRKWLIRFCIFCRLLLRLTGLGNGRRLLSRHAFCSSPTITDWEFLLIFCLDYFRVKHILVFPELLSFTHWQFPRNQSEIPEHLAGRCLKTYISSFQLHF